MNRYIPLKIKNNYVPTFFNEGENTLSKGSLICACGEESFIVKFCGETAGGDCLSDGEEAVSINAQCEKCGRELNVFDSLTDGYGAVMECRGDESGYEKRNMLDLRCQKCGKDSFKIEICYEHAPGNAKVSIMEDCSNAFTWIAVGLTCCNCGRRIADFLDMETA